jgi:hypothetical protein
MVRPRLGLNWRYAIGEVIIVVVGILIALAVDNWRDVRQSRRVEQDYLARLATDLKDDSTTFVFVDSALKFKSGGLWLADSVLNGGRVIRDTAAFLQAIITGSNFSWNQPRVRSITFQDLQSTGNLRVIRDLELRANIVRYYDSAEGVYERIRTRRTGYGALTYELLPRADEFVFEKPSDPSRLAVLTRRVLASDLGAKATAEKNFVRFLRNQNQILRSSARDLLKAIEQQM